MTTTTTTTTMTSNPPSSSLDEEDEEALSTIDVDCMEPRCRTVVFRGFLGGVPRGAISDALGGDGGGGGGRGRGADDAETTTCYDHYGDCVMRMITDSRSGKVREASSTKTTGDGNDGNGRNDVAEMTTTMTTMPPRGGRDVESGRVLPPPDNFLLMLLYPFRVDYLRLTDNYHRVDEWDRKGRNGRNGRRGILRREGDDNDDGNGDGDGSMCRWESMRVNP
ncbi:hypothetical protein ACHAXA_003858 [Cyclostephanos tholiformis]|uniref:Pyridoxamine 5'-phosphate oxidase Alr4036 family FMN-binding domain-containing protein n=1 Tax=Cyclostephanos tholiformis TaxID=382380 RepID=A0ABD3RWR5_9STRA